LKTRFSRRTQLIARCFSAGVRVSVVGVRRPRPARVIRARAAFGIPHQQPTPFQMPADPGGDPIENGIKLRLGRWRNPLELRLAVNEDVSPVQAQHATPSLPWCSPLR
jgi:hypothetical protein